MKKVIIASAFFAPAFAFAQTRLTNVQQLVTSVGSIISILIPIVAALALLYFFWGLARFILAADNEDARKEGKNVMIWGIVALFVITSVWGLTRFLGSAIGITDNPPSVPIPTVNTAR